MKWNLFKYSWKLNVDVLCERFAMYIEGIQIWGLCIYEMLSCLMGFIVGIFMIFLMPVWIIIRFFYMPFHIFFFRNAKLAERYAFRLEREAYYKKVWGDRA